jgi:predicted ester cyclase
MPTETTVDPATAPAETVIRRWIDAMNRGDLEALDGLVAADIVDHHLPPGLPAGRDGVRLWCSILHDALQLRIEIRDLVAAGDRVALRAGITGTHVGDFGELAATGRSFAAEIMTIERVADGRVAERWELVDMAAVTAQLTGEPG